MKTPKNEKESLTFAFSFSSASMLKNDIKKFHESYILGNKEVLDEPYLKKGQLLHCLVLNPEDLYETFCLMPSDLPSDNTKKAVDHVYSVYKEMDQIDDTLTLNDFSEVILAYLVETNLHQTLTDDKKPNKEGEQFTGDEKRIKKVIDRKAETYFTALKESATKVVIDMDMYTSMVEKAKAIKEYDAQSKNLLFATTDDEDVEEMRYEIELSSELEEHPGFGIKGILDCVKIDYAKQRIYITDLKTTSGELKDFQSSLEKYMYWMQAVFYKKLICAFVDPTEWTFEITFLVVDKKNYVYSFKVSDESLTAWEEKTKLELAKAVWHFKTNTWNLPYDYANNLVKL